MTQDHGLNIIVVMSVIVSFILPLKDTLWKLSTILKTNKKVYKLIFFDM